MSDIGYDNNFWFCNSPECKKYISQCEEQKSQGAETFMLDMSNIGPLTGLTYEECITLSDTGCDAYVDEEDENLCRGYVRQCIKQREQGADSFKLVRLDGSYERVPSFRDCCVRVVKMNDDPPPTLIQPGEEEEEPTPEKIWDGSGFYLGMDVGWEWANLIYTAPDSNSDKEITKEYDGNVTRIKVGYTGKKPDRDARMSLDVFLQHSNLQFHEKDLDCVHVFWVGLAPGLFLPLLGRVALRASVPFGINFNKSEDIVPGASKTALNSEPAFMIGIRFEVSFLGLVGLFVEGGGDMGNSQSIDCESDGCDINGSKVDEISGLFSIAGGLSFVLPLTGE